MSSADQERLTLVEGSTWRQTALPAGRIAVARGGLIFFLLASFYWLLVPLGPETTPTAELIASYWTSHSSPSVAASIQSGLLSFLSLLFPVAFSAKFLEITEVCLAFAVLVCWMRQLDASRSTVIPTALIVGLSPAFAVLLSKAENCRSCFSVVPSFWPRLIRSGRRRDEECFLSVSPLGLLSHWDPPCCQS